MRISRNPKTVRDALLDKGWRFASSDLVWNLTDENNSGTTYLNPATRTARLTTTATLDGDTWINHINKQIRIWARFPYAIYSSGSQRTHSRIALTNWSIPATGFTWGTPYPSSAARMRWSTEDWDPAVLTHDNAPTAFGETGTHYSNLNYVTGWGVPVLLFQQCISGGRIAITAPSWISSYILHPAQLTAGRYYGVMFELGPNKAISNTDLQCETAVWEYVLADAILMKGATLSETLRYNGASWD